MTCEETQSFFSPYVDDELPAGGRSAVNAHLRMCPVCRRCLSEMRATVRELSLIQRPAPPAGLAASISDALIIERAARNAQRPRPITTLVVEWVRPRLMPYTVGAFASLLLFVGIMSALRPQLSALRDLADASRAHPIIIWAPGEYGYDVSRPISPAGFAATRTPFAAESPSIDPRGALAALAWTPPSGRPEDDDMVVVADVYSNGSASLAAVMEPPRNPRMLDDLQDALRKSPAFVPASLDHRPQTMRVVFVLQKMKVEEQIF